MSPKQSVLYEEIATHGSVNLSKAVDLVGGDIYCNRAQYVGLILKRMMNNGWIKRVSRGVYAASKEPSKGPKVAMINCGSKTRAVMPSMENWAREKGIIS